MTAAAAAVARAVGYTNAGTIEFLLDEDGRFYFLEMNTRLQVEHPITEMVTGLDLVAVADPHRARRAARPRSGRAADARTATRSSAASTPRIPTTVSCRRRAAFSQLRAPAGPGIRDDSGATAGLEVPIFYDPMISKLVAWAEDRPARDRAHAPRARRVRRGRHQDDACRSSRGCSTQPDVRRRAGSTPTSLDEVLAARNGRPFVEPTPDGRRGRRHRRRAAGAAVAGTASARRRCEPAAAAVSAGWKAAGAGSKRACEGLSRLCSTRSRPAAASGTSTVASRRATVLQSSVDGRLDQVDAARIDAHTLSLIVGQRCAASARQRRSSRSARSDGGRRADGRLEPVGGARRSAMPVAVSLNGRRRRRQDEGGAAGSGPQRIVGADAGQGRSRAGRRPATRSAPVSRWSSSKR